MNGIAELKRMPQNKEQAMSLAQAIIDEMDEMDDFKRGEVMTIFKLMEKVHDVVKKSTIVQETMTKMATEQVEINGFKFEPHIAVSYDYKGCQQWVELKEKLSTLEATMKAIKEPVADTATGELIMPAIKKTSESYKMVMKK